MATRDWKKQEIDSTLDILEGEHTPVSHPGFSPVMLSPDFWPLELGEDKFLLFKATELLAVCYDSHKK